MKQNKTKNKQTNKNLVQIASIVGLAKTKSIE